MPDPEATLRYADAAAFGGALHDRHRPGSVWVVLSDLVPPSHPARFWGYADSPGGEIRAVANPLPEGITTNVRVDIWLRLRPRDTYALTTRNGRRIREGHGLLCSVLFNADEPEFAGELRAAFQNGLMVAAGDPAAEAALMPILERIRASLPADAQESVYLQPLGDLEGKLHLELYE